MKKETKKRINKVLFWILVVFMAFWMIFPFYWMVNSALKSETQLQMTPATFVPRDPDTGAITISLQNFKAVFQNEKFLRGIINSVIVAGSTTIISLVLGSFAAFSLGKLRFKGKQPTMYLILAMTMFPAISILSGLYAMMNWLNMPAIPFMILTYLVFTLPFTVWVQTSFFRTLPLSILQSAYVDGASPFQTFYLILLPLTAPALVTTGLLAFINAWNEYLFALTFTSVAPEARTVTVAIALFTGKFAMHEPFGEIMAAGVLVTIPLIVLVMIFQRRIMAGLTAGAVKG
ncbi:sugar ABC transporter permease [candidate division KSB3 bacterium]|uniref:Sugar ABC transporter permease n=1 Tax=candidate division KSB3 bacterium TaxID=2044937 RepID=A0A2G6KDA0_9BACT|nr:MAG: sugar ABC transporter permease [candidate division KSB3 bacterium]